MTSSKNDTQLKRSFMKDEAYNELRKWIITGKLQPGTKLRDQDLSDTLGISRTPIREALLRLENDGLVVTKANRWTLVSPINLEEAENIYSIVWTLEALAMEQAFPYFTLKDIDELERYNENLNKIMKTGNQIAKLQADNEFHNKILQLSHNLELPKLLSSLKLRIQRIEIHYFNEIDRMNTSYEEHKKIIDLLRKKNMYLAIEAIKSNWKNSLESIQQFTDDSI
ncbi:GntR family transcriptional regulator [Acetoanaerobium noterae]|uniref:GntR family transcriptional regulator n=1 Tax=Acetoanaerobium noterae TaxID=745369 RepID=UPI0028A69E21|nr:GntR family transcriptional regulator [Acetoanaerobium noterae]